MALTLSVVSGISFEAFKSFSEDFYKLDKRKGTTARCIVWLGQFCDV